MKPHNFLYCGLVPLLWACLHSGAEAQVQLAAAVKATAVIVADDWVPESTAAFARIAVTAGQQGVLLDDKFRGSIGQSIDSQGWNNSTGAFVVSYSGQGLGFTRAVSHDVLRCDARVFAT